MVNARGILIRGLKELGFEYTEKQLTLFLTYLSELKRWNKAYNLTALKTDRDIIIRHFLDSLLYIKAIPEGCRSLADIGSGAGFPGVPIKIIRPDLHVILIEPTQKKVQFLRHICRKLDLQDIEILSGRIEDIKELKVDVAVTRALFSVREFIKKANSLLKDNGILILSKGPKLEEELKETDSEKIIVNDFELPFEKALRHIVTVRH